MPRAPHLQSTAAEAPSTSTVTSYGWISAQDPALAADRGRRCCRQPGPQQALRQRLDDRAAELAPDLLAAVGDGQRDLEDLFGTPARGFVVLLPEQRREHRPPRFGIRRLAIHHRPGEDALLERRARQQLRRAGDERVRLDSRVDDRARVGRGILEPHDGKLTAARRVRRGRPGATLRASRWRDADP
jgi:hypothetical protein